MASLLGKFRSYKRAISLFDWESSLNNLDVNDQVSPFNENIMNMSNFVANELIICNDRDPRWMNRYIKNLIADLNNFHKKNLLYLAAIWTIFLCLQIYKIS